MSAPSIRDRLTIADHVMDVMHARHRDLSIDALLCRPFEAIAMALDVGLRAGRIKRADAKRIRDGLVALIKPDAATCDQLNEICRAALASRKRGDLKRDSV